MNAPVLKKICNVAELGELRERLRAQPTSGSGKETRQIMVCFGGSCLASGAKEVRDALRVALDLEKLGDQVALIETGCMGPCVVGPVVLVGEDRTFLLNRKPFVSFMNSATMPIKLFINMDIVLPQNTLWKTLRC